MNAIIANAEISGGAPAKDVSHVTDPLGLAAATGAVGVLVWPGLTSCDGYGQLIGRFELALDNLVCRSTTPDRTPKYRLI